MASGRKSGMKVVCSYEDCDEGKIYHHVAQVALSTDCMEGLSSDEGAGRCDECRQCHGAADGGARIADSC